MFSNLTNMLPRFSLDSISNCLGTNSKYLTEIVWRDSIFEKFPHKSNLSICKFMSWLFNATNNPFRMPFRIMILTMCHSFWMKVRMVIDSTLLSPFFDFISYIVGVRTSKKMERSDAARIVALVTDTLSFRSFWKLIKKGKAMSKPWPVFSIPTLISKSSIASFVLTSYPDPTISNFGAMRRYWSIFIDEPIKTLPIFFIHNQKTTPHGKSVVGDVESRNRRTEWKDFLISTCFSHNKAFDIMPDAG